MKQAISWRQSILPILSIFTSASTLVCCALPALLVSLGFGAVLAGLVTAVPGIVWVSENKGMIFIAGAVLLFLAGLGQYFSRQAPCPLDPELAKNCTRIRAISLILFLASLVFYCVGFFFAYLAIYVL